MSRQNSGGKNNTDPLRENISGNVSSNQSETPTQRRSLPSPPSSDTLSPRLMRNFREGIGKTDFKPPPPLEPTTPSIQLWQAIDKANRQAAVQRGTPLLNESRQQVLRNYLTTQASLNDLRPLAGVSTRQGVQDQLRRDMG